MYREVSDVTVCDSKPISCRFIHVALEAEIGKTGFQFFNLAVA